MKTKLLKLLLACGALFLLLGVIAPEIKASSTLSIVNDDNESLTDVVGAFNNINPRGIKHPINRNNLLQGSYYDEGFLFFPNYFPKNHLQSVQRLKGNYFAISGSNNKKDDNNNYGSTLFIVELSDDGPKVVNELYPASATGTPSDQANGDFWHAGGMALLGDILAVPLEGSNDSQIVFYNVADPMNPTKLDEIIYRSTEPQGEQQHGTHEEFVGYYNNITAGWVMLTKLETGHYLLGVWSDKYGLDLYMSSEANQFDFDDYAFTTICNIGFGEASYHPYCDNDFDHRLYDSFNISGQYQKALLHEYTFSR